MQSDPLRPYAEKLKELVRSKILAQVDASRQFQLIMALRNELFWRAKQFLRFQFIGANGISVVPVTGPPGSTGDSRNNQQPQALSYVFNITRSDGQKFVAIVGARAPHVTVEPKDAHDPESLKASRDGKAVVRYLEEFWDAQQHQKDLARTIFRSGPQFGHICWVTDEKKYGTADLEDTQLIDKTEQSILQCNECGAQMEAPNPDAPPVPCPQCQSAATEVIPGQSYQSLEVVGSRNVPRGMPELHPYTIFDVTIPQERQHVKECEWLLCETLTLSGKLRNIYGDLLASIKDEMPQGVAVASQETVAEAYDVISSADPAATNRENRWWWSRSWLRPEMYHYVEDQNLKKILFEQYPDGIRLVFVNGNYVEGIPEDLSDVWVVCKTGTDDRIMGDPICHDLIPINEIINNFFNLAIETVLRAIPKTIVNPRLVDRAAINANGANPAEVIFSKAGLAENLGDMVAKLPTASFSEQMMELAVLFRQYAREVDGVLEAVFGGGEPAPTWRQDQQRKNQALAQFYVAYDEMRVYWKQAHTLAIKMLQKFGVGQITVPSDDAFTFGPNVVDFSTLTMEKIRVVPEETMPETRAEEADKLVDQLAYPPQIQEALAIFHPVNVPRLVDLLSLRGMTSPYVHLVEKILKLIEQLVSTEPISATDPFTGMLQIDEMGQPIQMPSIAPDPFEFRNAEFAVEVVRAWVNSPAGLGYQQSTPMGFQNVKLFGMALDQIAIAQAMAAAPPEEPPKKQPAAQAA